MNDGDNTQSLQLAREDLTAVIAERDAVLGALKLMYDKFSRRPSTELTQGEARALNTAHSVLTDLADLTPETNDGTLSVQG